ncbi:MAG: hypothetical protein ACOX1P_29820 [Thermoguttaceae bacterium]
MSTAFNSVSTRAVNSPPHGLSAVHNPELPLAFRAGRQNPPQFSRRAAGAFRLELHRQRFAPGRAADHLHHAEALRPNLAAGQPAEIDLRRDRRRHAAQRALGIVDDQGLIRALPGGNRQ